MPATHNLNLKKAGALMPLCFVVSLVITSVDVNGESLRCPLSPSEWSVQLDLGATKIVQAARTDDRDRQNQATLEVHRVFAKCYDESKAPLQGNPELIASLANLKRFTFARRHEDLRGWKMGFNVPDAQYFKETSEFTEVPEDLKNPRLLAAFSNPQRIPEALRLLEELNQSYPADRKMLFFQYTSQHLTTPDASAVFGRVLIFVPGAPGVPEKWVQFGVPEKGKVRTQNVSVVAVRKNQDATSDIYFKDHFRMYDKSEIYLKSRFEFDGSGDSCIRCHKSGVLPIFPKPGSLAAADQPKLEFVNRKFRSYGPPHFGGYVNLEDLGPGMGPIDAASRAKRSDVFFSECLKGLEFPDRPASQQRISNSMTCTLCHNSTGGMGKFDFPINAKLVNSYVRGGLMPPGANLTAPEREGLLKCLNAEYLGVNASGPSILYSWLKGLGLKTQTN